MDNEQLPILKGVISKYYIEKCYGFIDTDDEKKYYFSNATAKGPRQEKYNKHQFRLGDEIEFKIKNDLIHDTIAYDLKFIQNGKRDKLIEEAKELNIIKGYLKKIDGEFFIKHLSTYFTIPVVISDWETDLDLIYYERENTVVTCNLHNIDRPYKLYATLTDRVFKPEYTIINEYKENDSTTFVTVTGKNEGGLFGTILNGSVSCFIRFIENEDLKFSNKTKGDIIEAKVISASPERKLVDLKIIHKKENDSNITLKKFVFRKEHFGETIVEKKNTTLIKRTHGIIVNTLAEELSARDFLIGTDSNRDLFIYDTNKEIKCIFEIKTTSTTQSIYTAVGQLIIYSIPTLVKSGLVIVLPDLLNEKIKDRLEDLGIRALYYSWHEGKTLFHDLDKTLKLNLLVPTAI